jgi:hypothetical protein
LTAVSFGNKAAGMKFLFFILFATTAFISFSQQTFIGGKEGNRSLEWTDFTGKPDKSSPFHAYTFWNIRSSMDALHFKSDTASAPLSGMVWVELGESSWVKPDKKTDDLLKHEQGHFNIGRLCMMELAQKIKLTRVRLADMKIKMDALFKEIISQYKEMDVQYDAETLHGNNKEAQERWDLFFKRELGVNL